MTEHYKEKDLEFIKYIVTPQDEGWLLKEGYNEYYMRNVSDYDKVRGVTEPYLTTKPKEYFYAYSTIKEVSKHLETKDPKETIND